MYLNCYSKMVCNFHLKNICSHVEVFKTKITQHFIILNEICKNKTLKSPNYGLNFRSSCCWTDDANCLSQLHCCQHHNDLIFDLCVKDHWSAWQWMNIEITSGKFFFFYSTIFIFYLNWDACIMYMCIKLLTCICSCIVVRR